MRLTRCSLPVGAVLAAALLVLSSCGKGSDSKIQVLISVDVSKQLESFITVPDAQGEIPGERNHVDVAITVSNESDQEQRLTARGVWRDTRSNAYGGFDQPLVLPPRGSETIRQGTNSEQVTILNLIIIPGAKDPLDQYAETVANPEQQIAEGYGMTFSETAGDEIVPALPITGVANGEVFSGRTVTFREGENHTWRLAISDDVFDPVKGAGIHRHENKALQTIYLDLPSEPAVGRKVVKEMSYGGGIFQIKTTPDADETTSWNTSLAYALEVTAWEKGPSADGPCGDPEVGRAAGKVYVSFTGSGMGHGNSWAAGEFTAAAVVYCGVDPSSGSGGTPP